MSTPSKDVLSDGTTVDIEAWIEHILEGTIGFTVFCDREGVEPTPHNAIRFALRCLGNTECRGAGDVVRAIIAKRGGRL